MRGGAARSVRLLDVVEDRIPSQPRIATNRREFKSSGERTRLARGRWQPRHRELFWNLDGLRNRLKRWNRFVDDNPRQFIFEEDHFLRRKWRRIVERRNREIDRVRISSVLEKQMSTTTYGKRTKPIGVRDPARFALRHDQIFTRHRSPLHIRRTRASPAIDAMTIDQRRGPTLQHVSCPAANASTSDFHFSERTFTRDSASSKNCQELNLGSRTWRCSRPGRYTGPGSRRRSRCSRRAYCG